MQLDARLGCRKPPLHRTRIRIDHRLPRRHLAGQRLPIRQTPRQTLAAQHAGLALRDVQPAPVLGRVVDLKAAALPPGLLGRIDMILARQLVHVPVVYQARPSGPESAHSSGSPAGSRSPPWSGAR